MGSNAGTRLIALALLGGSGCSGGPEGGDSGGTGTGTGTSGEPLQFEPIVNYDKMEFDGRPVIYYIPPDPAGVTWLFHGTNGGTEFCNKEDTVATTNLLLLENIGFICSQSQDQGPENQWDTESGFDSNPDVQFLFDLHAHFVETGDITADTPEFTLGFSNGGDFSGYFGKALLEYGHDLRAIAPHNSSGNDATNINAPYIWIMPVNDGTGSPWAAQSKEARDDKGWTSELWEPPEISPVTAEWFLRNPKVSLENAQKSVDHMTTFGLMDEQGFRLIEPSNPNDRQETEDTLEQAIASFEKEYPGDVIRGEELRVAWAIHRMNAYYAPKVRDFFVDAL